MSDGKEKEKLKITTRKNLIHTNADINWAVIMNKITIPNLVKTATTVETGCLGAMAGSGLFTGIGFAIGGPPGALLGYTAGNLMGGISGVIGGYKAGKFVVSKLGNRSQETVVNKGMT